MQVKLVNCPQIAIYNYEYYLSTLHGYGRSSLKSLHVSSSVQTHPKVSLVNAVVTGLLRLTYFHSQRGFLAVSVAKVPDLSFVSHTTGNAAMVQAA